MTEATARPDSAGPLRIGFLLFPGLTQLDLAGPFEVFARLDGVEIHVLWKTQEPVAADSGLQLLPTATLAVCPPLDLVCVPGGPGVAELIRDMEVLAFLRRMAETAGYVTSVCTGSLVLGAAGLLEGRRAACHWLSRPLLAEFGAEPVAQRVVVDGPVITGGGVTAGIDFALAVVAELRGRRAAEAIQLAIEYDPHPPFDAGSPDRADADLVAELRVSTAARQEERAALVRTAAAALGKE
jgi:cyclohexyl-isocyanide hydratase